MNHQQKEIDRIKRANSAKAGATDQRTHILAKLKRQIKREKQSLRSAEMCGSNWAKAKFKARIAVLEEMRLWIDDSWERARVKANGL